jgi:hypothetical protein
MSFKPNTAILYVKKMTTNARSPIAFLQPQEPARESTAEHLDSPLRDMKNIATNHKNREGTLIAVSYIEGYIVLILRTQRSSYFDEKHTPSSTSIVQCISLSLSASVYHISDV